MSTVFESMGEGGKSGGRKRERKGGMGRKSKRGREYMNNVNGHLAPEQ